MSLEKKARDARLFNWICPALVCSIAFQMVFLLSCSEQKNKVAEEIIRPAKTLTIKPTDERFVLRFPGKVRASQRVNLSFKVSGPLIEFSVREGQHVKKGDILARIDPRDFEINQAKIESAVSEAKAKLKAMEAGARPEDLRMLASEVSAAKAYFQEADLQYKRYATLYENRDVSKSEFDRFKAAWEMAGARLDTAIQNLEKGKKGSRKEDIEAMCAKIRGIQAQKEAFRNALDDTYLKAPFSGVIAKKFVENFQEVLAKQPIVSLQDISKIEILIHVSEVFMIQAKKDTARAVAEFAAAPGKQYPLTIKEFSTEADPSTQTYRAVLEMPAPKGINLLPGMTATVRGTLDCSGQGQDTEFLSPICKKPQELTTFMVPINAVFAGEAEENYVWVVDPNTMRIKKREVKIGGISGANMHILGGLVAGDRIVTGGVNYLQEGQKIRELKRQRGG